MSTEYTWAPSSLAWFCLESQILLVNWGYNACLNSQWQNLMALFLIYTHLYVNTATAGRLHCVHPRDCKERYLMQDQLVVPVHMELQWRSLLAFHCHLHISDLLRNQRCILSEGLQANNCVLKVERESLCCGAMQYKIQHTRSGTAGRTTLLVVLIHTLTQAGSMPLSA